MANDAIKLNEHASSALHTNIPGVRNELVVNTGNFGITIGLDFGVFKDMWKEFKQFLSFLMKTNKASDKRSVQGNESSIPVFPGIRNDLVRDPGAIAVRDGLDFGFVRDLGDDVKKVLHKIGVL